MQYQSILFPYGKPEERVLDAVLTDLRIDTVLDQIANGPDQLKYETGYLPLHDVETVYYRHAIFQDLEDDTLVEALSEFQTILDGMYDLMDRVDHLANIHMKELCLVENAVLFCETMVKLQEALCTADLHSQGLLQFRQMLEEYITGEIFLHLEEHSNNTARKIHSATYMIHMKDYHIDIQKHEEERDYGAEIREFFLPFLEGEHYETALTASSSWELNSLQADIVKCLEKIHPYPFSSLAHFLRSHRDFIPAEITQFHQDLGFYLTWHAYYKPMREAGLSFCYPSFAEGWQDQAIQFHNCFDLILASRCITDGTTVITNHLTLRPEERILVLTGPNQGGKTTYTRMMGQLFYLASLGIPVPGTQAHLFLPDHIYTHFERQESQMTLNGKLRDDLVRIHEILSQSTRNSLILINEMFASTTVVDAGWLGKKILEQIHEQGAFCLYVTFVNALAQACPGIISLISEIGEDLESRTYHIVRGDADGLAYAHSIVKKYQLTYDDIIARIGG